MNSHINFKDTSLSHSLLIIKNVWPEKINKKVWMDWMDGWMDGWIQEVHM